MDIYADALENELPEMQAAVEAAEAARAAKETALEAVQATLKGKTEALR